MFEKELEFFIAHQDELVKRYQGKVLIIRESEVIATFDSALEAFLWAQGRFKPGTYMIQPCEPGPAAYTVTIAAEGE